MTRTQIIDNGKTTERYISGSDESTIRLLRCGNIGTLEYRNDSNRTFTHWAETSVGSWPDDIPLPAYVGATSTDGTRGAGLGLQLQIKKDNRNIVITNRNNADTQTDQATIHCMLFW